MLYVLATVQFVGSYLYLEFPYVDIQRWETGNERLPFQTRVLLAPLYRYVDNADWSVGYAAKLARNNYFFPRGIVPGTVLEFALGIVCVLVSGWVAVRLYQAGSRRHLLGPMVYPLFLVMCTILYIVHTVQNFSYPYDMPSLLVFSLGFYVLYFRKSVLWFVLLFALGTLNRETTLLLLPFWAVSQSITQEGRLNWRGLVSKRVLAVSLPLCAYWLLWHHLIYSVFGANPSEYYPRLLFNLHLFLRLRYWPQLAAAFAFVWPFLIAYRKQIRDPLLRNWLVVLPVWYGFMLLWAIVTETRVYGELLAFLAPVTVIIAEEVLTSRVVRHLFSEDLMLPVETASERAAWPGTLEIPIICPFAAAQFSRAIA